MSNIKMLDNSISRLVRLQSVSHVEYHVVIVKDQIKQLVFENIAPDLFATLLNATVIDPVLTRISQLKDNLPLANRDTIKERTNIQSIIELLEVFLKDVYSNYSPLLKNSQHYFNNQEEALGQREAQRDSILHLQYDEVHLVTDLEPKHCKEILNRGFDKALTHFSRLQVGDGLRQEAITFATRGESVLVDIQENLSKLQQDLEKLKATKKSYSGTFTDEEGTIDLEELYDSKIVFMLSRIENVTTYHSILSKLVNKVSEMYSLHPSQILEVDDKTVFGNRNFEIVDKLFAVLQPFLHTSTKLEDFTHAFILQAGYDRDKIKFSNVNLNNYAGLISEMQPYFETVTQGKPRYNQWWAERFTFNGTEKTKTDISNMRSATNADRKPDHPSIIREVVEILKEI